MSHGRLDFDAVAETLYRALGGGGGLSAAPAEERSRYHKAACAVAVEVVNQLGSSVAAQATQHEMLLPVGGGSGEQFLEAVRDAGGYQDDEDFAERVRRSREAPSPARSSIGYTNEAVLVEVRSLLANAPTDYFSEGSAADRLGRAYDQADVRRALGALTELGEAEFFPATGQHVDRWRKTRPRCGVCGKPRGNILEEGHCADKTHCLAEGLGPEPIPEKDPDLKESERRLLLEMDDAGARGLVLDGRRRAPLEQLIRFRYVKKFVATHGGRITPEGQARAAKLRGRSGSSAA